MSTKNGPAALTSTEAWALARVERERAYLQQVVRDASSLLAAMREVHEAVRVTGLGAFPRPARVPVLSLPVVAPRRYRLRLVAEPPSGDEGGTE